MSHTLKIAHTQKYTVLHRSQCFLEITCNDVHVCVPVWGVGRWYVYMKPGICWAGITGDYEPPDRGARS